MDVISINNTVTEESKQMKAKTFVSVTAFALKRAVLNGSKKTRFKIFFSSSHKEESRFLVLVSDFH